MLSGKQLLRLNLVFAFGFASLAFAPAPAAAITLKSLVKTDALGYSCLPEDLLEAAFRAEGKKTAVLPQTCLPQPCVAQISRVQLASFMGYAPADSDWWSYIDRYADVCVAETPVAWGDLSSPQDTPDGVSTPAPDDGASFWAPFVGPAVAQAALPVPAPAATPQPGFDAALRSNFGVPGGGSISRAGPPPTSAPPPPFAPPVVPPVAGPPPNEPPPNDPPPTGSPPVDPPLPSPVPLPAAVWLLLAGLLAMARIGRRRA